MILADVDIIHFRNIGALEIFPWNPEAVQPSSYDLHLAPYIKQKHKHYQENACGHVIFDRYEWTQDKFAEDCRGNLVYELDPGEFGLFSTIEVVELGNAVVGQVMGKSSLAREAIGIETAGLVDPGFQGQLTLEIKNHGQFPVTLIAGMAIGQIVFAELRSRALRPYGSEGLGSKYQHQSGPTEPR